MTTIEKTNAIINGVTTKLDPNKEYTMTKDGLVETRDPLKEKWYRISEASKELCVSIQTIRNAVFYGNLPATEIPDSSAPGFHYMIKESDLIDWLDDKKKVRDQKRRDAYNARMREYQAKNYKPKEKITYEIPVDKDGVKMLDANTISERCGYRRSSIINAIRRRSLKATKHNVGGKERWYISEADYKAWIENGSHTNYRNNKTESKPTDIQKAVVEQKYPKDISAIADQIKKLLDEAYQKGLADGRASVEYDIEEVKNQAKDELLAALKGMKV